MDLEPTEAVGRQDRREERQLERRRRRRRAVLLWLAGLLALALVFFVGLVVGQAIEDAPRPGGEQTIVRTLVPETIGPAGDVVTVTVTTP
jgi:predicted nucleic acid-binding Zn ribbon protein